MFFQENQGNSSDKEMMNQTRTVDKVKLPSTLSKPQIVEHYGSINDLLDKMNKTIERIKRIKEEMLKGSTLKQIKEAQQQVQVLTQLTSEEEVQRKLKLKRKEIDEQRSEILQSSMEFSNKCIEYKNSLTKVMNCTKDLFSEIKFLDTQINNARMTNQQLKKQLENIQTNVSRQEYYSQQETVRQPDFIGMDIDGVSEELSKAQTELSRARRYYENVDHLRNDNAFQENEIERIFLECVQKIKIHKQQQDVQKLSQQIKNPKQVLKPIQSLRQFQRQADELNKQDIIFSDLEFNDIHKRMIFDEFLSRNEIKALIYNLL